MAVHLLESCHLIYTLHNAVLMGNHVCLLHVKKWIGTPRTCFAIHV